VTGPVIGNGAGGEPLSCKDALLLAQAPHLDLDGLNVAAAAASADKVFIYAPARVVSTVQHAVDERAKAKVDPPPWGPASRTAPAAYDGTGEPAQHGDIGVETDFRDGHLRHDDLKKPLTSQL
jgi:Respiratory-chain NADH dehydrogenase 51 Kd subunit